MADIEDDFKKAILKSTLDLSATVNALDYVLSALVDELEIRNPGIRRDALERVSAMVSQFKAAQGPALELRQRAVSLAEDMLRK